MPPHFLMTRINVPLSDPRSRQKRHDPEWIRYRFELMDNYAIPAVARQTEHRFQWIWEVDPATPASLLQTIKRKASQARAQIRFDRNWYPDDIIMMTRFDSDDFISSQFVEQVQDLTSRNPQRPLVVDTPRGWKTDGREVWTVDGKGSTFVTLVSNPRAHGDVWQTSHRDLVKRFPSVAATDRLWCVVIHGDNLMNRLRRTGPALPISHLQGF